MEVVSPLVRYSLRSLTTQELNTQSDSLVDLSQVQSVTVAYELEMYAWFEQ